MKIFAIETSCDETCAAVTEHGRIFSNVIWSQTSMHAQFGGVMPSVAKRAHEERIDWVINQAIKRSGVVDDEIDAIAVTVGPGLAIALEVGIRKAKELALRWKKPLVGVNHVEGHVLSPLATGTSKPQATNLKLTNLRFPAMAMVVSGGTTQLILVKEIGKYEIVAETVDDAIGEGLDKAARMLGLGYPGGAILEKMAKLGNPKAYPLPLPMAGREDRKEFSYSGLKTAFLRLVAQVGETEIAKPAKLSKQEIADLSASYQDRAFQHLVRVSRNVIKSQNVNDLLVGGGVAANVELRKRLRGMSRELGISVWFPYSKRLYGDNAAMIGIAAGFKFERNEIVDDARELDRKPKFKVDENLLG